MELWKNVKQLELLYEVSSLGNIRSKHSGKVLKTSLDRDGYRRIKLRSSQKDYYFRVGKLVAETFIDNPDNLPVVNHKNLIRTDDRVENLEWTNIRENTCHGLIRSKKLPIGVSRRYNWDKFRARITFEGKTIHVGDYSTPEEAHEAYITKLKELKLNNKYA